MSNETIKSVSDYCAAQGIRIDFEFVPQRFSRNAEKQEPSLNWRVTIERHAKRMIVDYTQGIGHVPGRPQGLPRNARIADSEASQHGLIPAYEPAKGVAYRVKDMHGNVYRVGRKLPPPQAADVLYCLTLDLSALDAGSFEDWANDYGYDTDSREAERIYNACITEARDALRVLGRGRCNQLAEMLQEY